MKFTNKLISRISILILLMNVFFINHSYSEVVSRPIESTNALCTDFHILSKLSIDNQRVVPNETDNNIDMKKYGEEIGILIKSSLENYLSFNEKVSNIVKKVNSTVNTLYKLSSLESRLVNLFYDKFKNFRSNKSFNISLAFLPKKICESAIDAVSRVLNNPHSPGTTYFNSFGMPNVSKEDIKIPIDQIINVNSLDEHINVNTDNINNVSLVGFNFHISYIKQPGTNNIAENDHKVNVSGDVVFRIPSNFNEKFNIDLKLNSSPSLNYLFKDVSFSPEKKHNLMMIKMEGLSIDNNGVHPYTERELRAGEGSFQNIKKVRNENLKFNIIFTDKVKAVYEINNKRFIFGNDNKGYNPLIATLINQECAANKNCSATNGNLNVILAKIDHLILELKPWRVGITNRSGSFYKTIYFPSPRVPEARRNEKGSITLWSNFGVSLNLNKYAFGVNLINSSLDLVTKEIFSRGAANVSYGLSLLNYLKENLCQIDNTTKFDYKDEGVLESEDSENSNIIGCSSNLMKFNNRKTEEIKLYNE